MIFPKTLSEKAHALDLLVILELKDIFIEDFIRAYYIRTVFKHYTILIYIKAAGSFCLLARNI